MLVSSSDGAGVPGLHVFSRPAEARLGDSKALCGDQAACVVSKRSLQADDDDDDDDDDEARRGAVGLGRSSRSRRASSSRNKSVLTSDCSMYGGIVCSWIEKKKSSERAAVRRGRREERPSCSNNLNKAIQNSSNVLSTSDEQLRDDKLGADAKAHMRR